MAIVFFRTFILFLSLLVAMRLMGKRQLGELELSELVVAVLISDIASIPLQDIGIPLINGIIPMLVLLCCELIISGLIVKSPRARLLVCGRPCILIADGEINQEEMRKNRFTLDELAEELRNQSVLDIDTIKYAILETDGKLNLILCPAERPVTAGQLCLEVQDTGYTVILINSGRIMSDNLRVCGKDDAWLKAELARRKVRSAKEVYLMTINSANQIYFAKTEGKR
ncbi:MAG: DUF421 domain-containing protein [Oscillospiraceae bacterium]